MYCADINRVVRPAGYSNQSLPVLVWIYGGGLYWGSSADPQYNLSGIVNTASSSGQPFIGVSINYRPGVWGFLQNAQVLVEGSSNAGLLDQRMAMQWIKENIASFGGDASRITLWGESAGAQSIAYHMHSFDGRNDDLYHAAILESGSTVGAQLEPLPFYNVAFENLTRTVGCWSAIDRLSCLRDLSSEALYNSRYSLTWNPIVDGTFLTAYPSQLAAAGSFVKVPLLIGANTDEGISFSVRGLENETALFNSLLTWRNYALSPPSIRKLLELYPNVPSEGVPYNDTSNTTYASYGSQWRRSAAIGGDMVMISGRRKMCEQYVSAGVQDVYSYRFDTPLWNASAPIGAKHFDNVMFSFQNISGVLGPLPQYEHYRELSTDIGRAYANFVAMHNPNGVVGLPEWPKYDVEEPKNVVLNANGSWVEDDTWRKEAIDFINTISRELLA